MERERREKDDNDKRWGKKKGNEISKELLCTGGRDQLQKTRGNGACSCDWRLRLVCWTQELKKVQRRKSKSKIFSIVSPPLSSPLLSSLHPQVASTSYSRNQIRCAAQCVAPPTVQWFKVQW